MYLVICATAFTSPAYFPIFYALYTSFSSLSYYRNNTNTCTTQYLIKFKFNWLLLTVTLIGAINKNVRYLKDLSPYLWINGTTNGVPAGMSVVYTLLYKAKIFYWKQNVPSKHTNRYLRRSKDFWCSYTSYLLNASSHLAEHISTSTTPRPPLF